MAKYEKKEILNSDGKMGKEEVRQVRHFVLTFHILTVEEKSQKRLPNRNGLFHMSKQMLQWLLYFFVGFFIFTKRKLRQIDISHLLKKYRLQQNIAEINHIR